MNLLEVRRGPLKSLRIIPDRSLRNYNVEALTKAFAEFYIRPASRVSRGAGGVVYETGDTFSFEVHMSPERIAFYLIVPACLKRHFKQKISSVWDKATVLPAPSLVAPMATVGPTDSLEACELIYKRNDLFSLNTDKDIDAPWCPFFPVSRIYKKGMPPRCRYFVNLSAEYSGSMTRGRPMNGSKRVGCPDRFGEDGKRPVGV